MRVLPIVVLATLAGIAGAQEDALRYVGAWRGSFLLFVSEPSLAPHGAPRVHPGQLQIDSNGRVRGRIDEVACVLDGTAADYISPANATLELTLSDCRDPRFNGHFGGKIIGNAALGYSSLRIVSRASLDAPAAQLSAILRR